MAMYRCTLQYFKSDDATRGQNVVYMEDTSNIMTADAIGQALNNDLWGQLRFFAVNNIKPEVIFIKRVDTDPEGGTIPFTPTALFGSEGFNVLHNVVGLIFQLYDGQAGRAHRGRIYHFGSTTNVATRQGPTPTGITRFVSARTAWLNAFGPSPTSGLFWNIYHRGEVGAARWTRVTDIRMSARLGVQRRRNIGIGL